MLNNLQQLEQKLSSKALIPSNPQHLISHFTRIAEAFYEMAATVQIQLLSQKCLVVLELCLSYPFPVQQHRGISNAIASWIVAMSKVDGLWIVKCNDCLLSFMVKKGQGKKYYKIHKCSSIAVEILYALLVMRSQLPTISFNTLIEVAQIIIKMIKASNEILVRISLARFLAPLIEEGVCSKEVVRTEIMKYTLKFCQSDKSDLLRQEGIKALIELLRKDVALVQNYESMQLIVNKMLLENNIQKYAIEAISLLNHKQVELERQLAHLLILKKSDKKNPISIQAITQKEYVTKMFGNFNDSLLKSQRPLLILESWRRSLSWDIEKFGQVIARGACEVVINALVGTSPDDPQLPYLEEESSKISKYLIEKLQKSQLNEILDYLLEKLKQSNKIKFNHIYVAKLLLNCIKNVSDIMGTAILSEKISKPNQLIDQIGSVLNLGTLEVKIHHMTSPINISCDVQFIETMKSFFVQNPKWQQSTLSVLLNLTTIYTADLGVQLNTHTKTSNLLRGHAVCLTKLVSMMDSDLHSTPLELSGQLWDTARGLIIGHFLKSSTKSPTHQQAKFDAVTQSNCMQKETGWILIAELLSIGFMASQQRLKDVLGVIQDSMTYLSTKKTFSGIDEYNQFLVSFGKIPLVIRRIINGPIQKYLSDNIHKFLVQQMIFWYQTMLKCELKVDRNNNVLITAKAQAFRTFSCMQAKAYSSHINALVQIAVDDVLVASTVWDEITSEQLQQKFSEFIEAPDELTLALSIFDFFGQIMTTSAFTLKNKINLVKYWQTNLTTVISSKDTPSKPYRVIPYLLIVRRVLQQLQSGGDSDSTFLQCLLSIIDTCSLITTRIVKCLVGETYSLALSLQVIDKEAMLKYNISQHINKFLLAQNPLGSTVYALSHMISKQKMLKDNQQDTINLQIQNLFVKLSSQTNLIYEDLIEMICEVSDSDNLITQNLTKGTFIFLSFSQMALQKYTDLAHKDLWYLAQILLNYFKMTDTRVKSSQLLGTYVQTLLGDIKTLLLQSKQPKNQVMYAQLCYYSLGDTSQLLTYLTLYKELQDQGCPERWDLIQLFNDILGVSGDATDERMSLIYLILNNEFKLQHIPEREGQFSIQIKQLKKVFMREFHYLLSHRKIHQQIQYLQSYILEEHVQEKETTSTSAESTKNTEGLVDGGQKEDVARKTPIENHSRTRQFLLQRVNKLFTKFQPKQEVELVNAATHIFTFLFKACTSHLEEIRDIAYKIFFTFFKSALPFDENGVQQVTINHSSSMLRMFAAQIDAILSETIKREDFNTPQTNTFNMTLIVKFFKIVLLTDPSLAKKMVNFLSKGLDNGLILTPSQFYSEKGMTLQIIQRIHSIGKILKFLQIHQKVVSEIFSMKTLSLLYCNVVVLLQDSFIVLCTPRIQIKNYTKFRFLYNGSRSSYDSQLFFQKLPIMLEVYISVKQFELEEPCEQLKKIIPEHQEDLFLSLVNFVLTQQTPIESISTVTNQENINYISKGLQCLLNHIKFFPSPNIVNGTIQILNLLMEYSQNKQLLPIIVHLISELAKQSSLVQDYADVLIVSINYLIVIVEGRPEKTILINSLIELSSNKETERVLYLIWQHLSHEEDLSLIRKFILVIAQIQSQTKDYDYVMLNLIDELIIKPTSSKLYLLFAINSILNVSEYIEKIDTYIDQNILLVMNTTKQIIAKDRNVDDIILGSMMPAFARLCVKHLTSHGKEPETNTFIEMIKFMLVVYTLSQDKQKIFTSTLRILLLFLDPILAQNQELLQITQQAIKHIINITDVQTIKDDIMAYPEKLKMMVIGMYQQAAQEAQLRQQQEEQKKQIDEQQVQQGTIKLKLFGQK